MKLLLALLLLTVTTQSKASELAGDPYTAQRTVVLTFEGSPKKVFFFIQSGMTKETVDTLIREKTKATVQLRPKTIRFSTNEITFPAMITDDYLEACYPQNASIKLHVIEYEVQKLVSRF